MAQGKAPFKRGTKLIWRCFGIDVPVVYRSRFEDSRIMVKGQSGKFAVVDIQDVRLAEENS